MVEEQVNENELDQNISLGAKGFLLAVMTPVINDFSNIQESTKITVNPNYISAVAQLLHEVSPLLKSNKDVDVISKINGKPLMPLRDIVLSKEQLDKARDILSTIALDDDPLTASIGKHLIGITNDLEKISNAVKGGDEDERKNND